MAKIEELKTSNGEVGGYMFYCPGCEELHHFDINRWSFNGDVEKPTFSPSLLYPKKTVRCHLFMREGKIEFLSDCGHGLAGKTVDCPDMEEYWNSFN